VSAGAEAERLVGELASRQVELWFEGDRLRFRAPKDALTTELRSRLGAARDEVLQLLRARAAAEVGRHPLSFGQRALWVLHLRAPGSAAYNVALSARLCAPLDPDALRHASQALVDRHAILRTTYGIEEGRAVQRVAGHAAAALALHDAQGLDAPALRELVLADYRRPFDLERGPPCRFSVYSCGPQEHVLLLTVHHIAADGWTLLQMMEEFARLHSEVAQGTPARLERPPMQYLDCARWQAEQLDGREGERLWDFWRTQLEALPPPSDLPTDRPRPAAPTFTGGTHEFSFDAALSAALVQLARQEGTTPFVLLLTAFHVLLHRLGGATDVLIGTPAFGRPKAEFLRVAGNFVNSVPVRARIDAAMPFRDLLAQVRQTMLGVLDAQDYPLPLLVQRLGVERDAARSPLFDVMFALQRFERFKAFETLLAGRDPQAEVEVGGLRLRPFVLPQQEGQFDLSMGMVEVDGQFVGALKYSHDLFDGATVAHWAAAYATLLRSIVAAPATPVRALHLLAPAARAALLAPARQPSPRASGGAGATLHERFESQAAARPGATALRFAGRSMSYGELDAQANRLAQALVAAGAGPGTVVGLCLERTPDLVAALLGILKSGAAYLPLDLAYPAERVQFILEDAKAPLLVTHSALRERLPAFAGTVLEVDDARLGAPGECGVQGARHPLPRARPDDLVYVIYTSGSTGRPKGTLLTHHAVCRLLDATHPWFGFDHTDRWTLFHSIAFDFSVWELWGALAYGGTLVLVPHLVSRAPDEFLALVRDEGVTVLNQTPSAFRQLVQADLAAGPAVRGTALRHVIFGGEALELQSLRPWFERHGDTQPRLVNMYGITETCVHVTYRPITMVDVNAARGSLIGEPIPDLRLLVLEPGGEPTPVGAIGEIHVGGPGLALGYLNRPELTAERFVPDPFVPGERLYRSGDLARRTADGELEYIGRRDLQVKIRGFRIELGEIEAALGRHAQVRQAVVVVRHGAAPGAGAAGAPAQLVAYVVAPELGEAALRESLRAALPEYMVPGAFVFLPTLPLTANGKVDTRALPEPAGQRCEAPVVAAGNETEAQLLTLWRQVLRRDDLGVTDNFFDHGGHSLLAVELLAHVREATGRHLPFAAVFEAPTVQQMARLIEPAPAPAGATTPTFVAPAEAPSPAEALLQRLAALGVRIEGDEGRLRIDAPKGAIDEPLRQQIVQLKPALLQALADRGRVGPVAPGDAAAGSAARGATPAGGSPPRTPVPVRPRHGPLPLSHMQQRLWFLKQLDPGNAAYNVAYAIRFRGALDAPLLQACLEELVRRHESLHTRFVAEDGVPQARIEPMAALPVRHLDLRDRGDVDNREAALKTALDQFCAEPFDTTRAPLVRLLWVRLDAEQCVFCLVVDHLVADGLSLAVLLAELRQLYGQRFEPGRGAVPPGPPRDGMASGATRGRLPALPMQYADWVAWQDAEFARGALAEHRAFWTRQLDDLPELLPLPTDRPRPPLQTYRGARAVHEFSPGVMAAVREAARELHGTSFMVLLAAFMALLQRHAGVDDIALGTAVGNRTHPDAAGVVGFFANNVVLRGDLSGQPTVREHLGRVREMCLASMAHQAMPFDLLVETLVKRRETDRSPLFQVMFVLHGWAGTEFSLPQSHGELLSLDGHTARYDLTADLFEADERLAAAFEYNADLFDADTIRRLMVQYETLLVDFLQRPQARLADLRLLTEADHETLLRTWNATEAPYPQQATVHGLFEAQAARTPTAPALVFEDQRLSYGELNARANRLAHALRARGVGRGALVGVWLDRSVEMVVAVLGTLKAGAAYVPLDPAFPEERIALMMSDAALGAVVTQSSVIDAADAHPPAGSGPRALSMPVLRVDADADAIAAASPLDPEPTALPADLAYVIYTSGSTGRPKGVMLEHRSVVNFLVSMQREPGIGPGDRFVAVTTLSFDIAGLEIHGPLTCGGTVVLASRSTALDGAALARLLQAEAATLLQATPATWRLLLENGWQGHQGSRGGLKMLCGGEALPRDLAERLLALPGELWNLYGPTETTIWSTATRVADLARPIAIGRPIANTQVYVLDGAGRPTPVGVAGELCIGGDGLARGYLGQPALTAEKFTSLDLPGLGPRRVYRTGDVARWRADGQLEFAGRRDHQVKLRGFRIELGEIEAVLATHPGVAQALVQVREDQPGDQRLVGYVVAPSGFSADEARATLRAKLPEYMVPNLFVTLAAFPLTPNGKVDRKGLPAPLWSSTAPAEPDDAVMSAAEQRVAAAWRELLGVSRIGLADNFFDLGGHSLLLVKLQTRLQREFATEVPLVEFFQRTTVQSQAERLQRGTLLTDDAAPLQRARARADKVRRSSHA